MGRFSVEFVVANYRDAVRSGPGEPVLKNVKQLVVSGVVGSGVARLVLPKYLLVDFAAQSLYPRDPDTIVTEIE